LQKRSSGESEEEIDELPSGSRRDEGEEEEEEEEAIFFGFLEKNE
jgi:hypothetical protein